MSVSDYRSGYAVVLVLAALLAERLRSLEEAKGAT